MQYLRKLFQNIPMILLWYNWKSEGSSDGFLGLLTLSFVPLTDTWQSCPCPPSTCQTDGWAMLTGHLTHMHSHLTGTVHSTSDGIKMWPTNQRMNIEQGNSRSGIKGTPWEIWICLSALPCHQSVVQSVELLLGWKRHTFEGWGLVRHKTRGNCL